MKYLSFVWRFRFPVAIGVLVASALLWFHSEQSAAELRGAIRERSRALDSTIAVLNATKARVDTVWKHDSTVYTRSRVLYDTLPAVVIHDTAYVRKDAADSVVHAADSALVACSCELAVTDSLLRLERAKPKATADTVRSVPLREKAKWAALGAATLALLNHFIPRK